MSQDLAILRASGVILWHLRNGGSQEEAIARASAREPDLTRAELAQAHEYCKRHMLACEIATEQAKVAWGRIKLAHGTGTDPDFSGLTEHTIEQILNACGIECE